jgi:phenylacetate-coenzyme A ligase PaaK-like adenylate-forming protein
LLGSAFSQLRYGFSILRGKHLNPQDLERICEEMLATLREYGDTGTGGQDLPGGHGRTPPDVQKTVTDRALRVTARSAVAGTAYYAELLGRHGVDAGALTAENLEQVPVTTKASLRGRLGAFVSRNAEPALLSTTTGTTGMPTSVWFSRRELRIFSALSTIAAVTALGLRQRHTLAYAGCSRATLALTISEESVVRSGASFVQIGMFDPDICLERLAAPLGLRGKLPQISHITAPTSYLAALVHAATSNGWTAADFGLRNIQVAGEILTDALRARAQEVFGAEVTDSYLSTETAPAGASVCEQGHLHFGHEFAYYEVVDPYTFTRVGPGEIGVLVATPYAPYRDCTLLLRYATGDLVRTVEAPPTCELSHLPATSPILGRFTGPLSLRIHTRRILELLESERGVPLPARYSITEDRDQAVLHVLVGKNTAQVTPRLEERAGELDIPLDGIKTYEDRDDMPPCAPVRADLREGTFELRGWGRP